MDMMPDKRQEPTWRHAWGPLLLLGGLLVLERQLPLSPGGHWITELVIALLLYGLVGYWLWYTRKTPTFNEHTGEKERERAHQDIAHPGAPASTDHEPWDYSWLSAQRNGHRTNTQKRRKG